MQQQGPDATVSGPGPGPSCVPLKLDRSDGCLSNFKGEPATGESMQQQRPDSPGPGPSCVSMKSDSDGHHIDCKGEPAADERVQQISEDQVSEQHQTDLDSVFLLQDGNIFTFVKDELKKIQKILSPEYPECLENEGEDDDQRSSREAFVKITLDFLRKMNQEELADCLQSRTAAPGTQRKLKSHHKEKSQCLFEGVPKVTNPVPLDQVYTELYITEGGTAEVNNEHDVRQIETTSRKQARPETPIRQEDLFKGGSGPIRTVMTQGVAGIGKTVLTQKFTLDWAEDKTNQDIKFLFPFTFRELNVMKEKKFSLEELLQHFFPEVKQAGLCRFEGFQVLFILDGLDECRLPLNFHNTKVLTDITESTSLDVLLTNLIRGNLLPSARLWITTRPAAANQIPPECVDRVTEVKGFTDPQKEEYFRKRFRDQEQANRIISHIKTSRTLHVMCTIPIFCWITATVLEDMLKAREGGKLPKTLAQMYMHFLVVQSKLKTVKYDGGSETDPHWSPETRKMMESLGKLAFDQLQKDNLIFYESDLTECGIDIRAASVYSGVFSQVFREERGLYRDQVFCFIHLSVQEFLAALHVHLTFINSGVNLMLKKQTSSKVSNDEPDLTRLHQSALDKALKSPNGHLDLFLRFLLGLSLETNQNYLRGLQTQTGRRSKTHKKTVQYIKKKINKDLTPERSINLFHCLSELNDGSLVKEIQQYLRSGHLSTDELSHGQWSALVFILLSSEEDLDVFDLKKYAASEEGLQRLLSVVKASNKALLSGCNLSERSCGPLASVLRSQSSSLIDLDLSNNDLKDSGVDLLCGGLKSPDCRLETLRLSGCNLSERSCGTLASVLRSQSSSLIDLDLSNNDLKDSGVDLLCGDPKSPDCRLETLRLSGCNLSERSCGTLSSVLRSQSSSLIDLDLSNNDLKDSGVDLLCGDPKSPDCRLETLRLSGCNLSERSCGTLSSVLRSQSSSLIDLDLSNNDLKDSGVDLLCGGLKSPDCRLETLSLSGCLVSEDGCSSLASALDFNPSYLRHLDLSYNHPGPSGVQLLAAGLEGPHWRLESLRVDHGGPQWLRPGLKKYATKLEVDTNAVYRRIRLSNMKVTLEEEVQPYPDHPDRFDSWPQLLCRDAVTGRCYWEVEWEGRTGISVSYREIGRKGDTEDCMFGGNDQSWCLDCSVDGYFVSHKDIVTPTTSSFSSSSSSGRVAVYVDCPAGILSFYRVSSSSNLIHLRTFNTTFTKPVYPGFGLWSFSGSVSLCPVWV